MDGSFPQPRRRGRGRQTPVGLASDVFSQLALWTAANLAGMATALLIARRPFFRKLVAQLGGSARNARKPSNEESLPMLAQAVLGSSKAIIAGVFGPPRSAVVDGPVSPQAKEPHLQANTWYYPLPRQGPLAMAINFSEGYAHRVEFFRAPET